MDSMIKILLDYYGKSTNTYQNFLLQVIDVIIEIQCLFCLVTILTYLSSFSISVFLYYYISFSSFSNTYKMQNHCEFFNSIYILNLY